LLHANAALVLSHARQHFDLYLIKHIYDLTRDLIMASFCDLYNLHDNAVIAKYTT